MQVAELREYPLFGPLFGHDDPNRKAGKWREELNQWWRNLREGDRVFVPLCALNVLVFLGWRFPGLNRVMLRHFACNPSAPGAPAHAMLFSAFSHVSFLHLFMNMYVLKSFVCPLVELMGPEQFVGLYTASAVVSAFSSSVAKVATQR